MKKTTLIACLFAGSLAAQAAKSDREGETQPKIGAPPTTEQDRKIDILSQEIEKLKAGRELFPAVKATGKFGLGPAASKVYDVQQGVSIGGYGEVLYERFDTKNQGGTDVTQNKVDQFDFVRAIVYFGYKFNENIVL